MRVYSYKHVILIEQTVLYVILRDLEKPKLRSLSGLSCFNLKRIALKCRLPSQILITAERCLNYMPTVFPTTHLLLFYLLLLLLDF